MIDGGLGRQRGVFADEDLFVDALVDDAGGEEGKVSGEGGSEGAGYGLEIRGVSEGCLSRKWFELEMADIRSNGPRTSRWLNPRRVAMVMMIGAWIGSVWWFGWTTSMR